MVGVLRGSALGVCLVAAACRIVDARDEGETSDTSTDTTGSSSTSSATDDTSSGSGADDTTAAGSDDESSTGDGPAGAAVTRYPSDRTHSPITAAVAMSLQQLREGGPALADDVFMKVGASSDVSPSNLHCFATAEVELDTHAELGATLDVFLAGDADGTTPFDRESLATESGRTAQWATGGDPSPLLAELDAIAPSLAFVHFGTNDMGLGVDPGAALPGFFESMSTLLDMLTTQGVVPIVVGLTHRTDSAAANLWIEAYNEVLRAMAQARQTPFIDAWWAIDPLPGHGLGPDGLHLESDPAGPCIFTADGLQHGYNVRNLIQLEALDRMELALADAPPDDDVLPPVEGDGSAQTPWTIDVLPFVHDADTSEGEGVVDLYGCASADESGPELTYLLELEAETALRFIALDAEGVDVDVHVLSGSAPDTCVARDDSIVAGTFTAGQWRIVIDTWSDGRVAFPGRYVLVVVPCDAGDPDCAAG